MLQDMKIAIVGLGGMGDWHRELIESIDGLTLAGIYDIKEERQEYAKEKNIRVYGSFDELLADEEVELCLIATPNDLHKPLAIAAMKAGKHVVSEKPVTLSSEDLKEMIAASEETGKLFTVHQNRRWDEDFLTMKKIYDDNLLGEVFRIESRVHGSRGIPGDWRQLKEQGGGMVLDWGVHLLDQILLMLKGVKLNKVYATITHVTNQLVDDGFTTSLLFENGVEVIIEVGTSNFVNLPRWYMLGANGTAIIEDWSLKGEIVSAKGQNEKDVVPVKTAAGLTKTMAPRRDDTIAKTELPVVKSDIRDFYRNVIKTIRGEEEINVKLPEVARVMRLMEAIFEAAEKQQVVDFE
ncbi:Gfo/Idh/MocA family oxidoreductase [Anaerocolumna sp. AGMB13020]|uniref:Gfo/Idh/MocA family protein n=1 Tax=Anaerocolumna sp. AGMB13020 TaxID=3081750 RepID=UPI002954D220|nr:Gfo/Idh/MocA family oxidoreductase [Anaerocolumna sp. AGMB13020]WOO35538.1 Gfo/Idh/MocA family oxidoreductase [Anaerocolumna sp. AGMB13020]